MNAKVFLIGLSSLSLFAQGRVPQGSPIPPQAPPPIATAPTPAAEPPKQVFVYDQKPLQEAQPVLVSPEQAKAVVEKFTAAYPGMGKPKIVIFVNRDLIDEKTGFKLANRTEKTESVIASNKTEKVTAENRYHNFDKNSKPVTDKQQIRDIERYFGRPLRMAGATLADQSVAVQMLADHQLSPSGLLGVSEAARKDREALSKIADVAIEVLVTTKNVSMPGITGDQTYALPDFHATAVRLTDAKVLGQAGSSDMTARDAGRIARTHSFRDVAEATALALMEDMVN